MTQYLSNKLTLFYTLLIIMVVYIHSYYLEAEQYPTALFLQKLTGGVFVGLPIACFSVYRAICLPVMSIRYARRA